LGVFGMGNMWEPLLTKFGAPFIMVAYGWHTVAQSLGCCPYSLWGLPILGVDEGRATDLANSRRSEGSPPQIYAGVSWSLLKIFRCGGFLSTTSLSLVAFVALALWLPRYYGWCAYGLDIKAGGHDCGCLFHSGQSLFRALLGGMALGQVWGASLSCIWTFSVSVRGAASFFRLSIYSLCR
jgi:NNP family nitrate/nitrite transporter-like MFS transporter